MPDWKFLANEVILLFTDFGPSGPYVGQLQAVLQQHAPNIPVIPLVDNAPSCNPTLSAYLLAALRLNFPDNSIFLGVVDPGVGGSRKAIVVQADAQYYVGPDNGLFNTVAAHSQRTRWWEIDWQPANCSQSFHGRDIFAPVAASLATNSAESKLKPLPKPDLSSWPADLAELIYFDYFGNALTGIRYNEQLLGKTLQVNGLSIKQAKTFSAVAPGAAFWYQNACGLVEVAVNQGRAKEQLALALSMEIKFV